jgi:hypothetical protein
MTEEEIRAEMRLRVLEGLVTSLLSIHCVTVAPSDPVGAFATMRKNLTETMETWGFPELDPAMSVFYAAELEAALDRQLEFASKQIETIQKALKGQTSSR